MHWKRDIKDDLFKILFKKNNSETYLIVCRLEKGDIFSCTLYETKEGDAHQASQLRKVEDYDHRVKVGKGAAASVAVRFSFLQYINVDSKKCKNNAKVENYSFQRVTEGYFWYFQNIEKKSVPEFRPVQPWLQCENSTLL